MNFQKNVEVAIKDLRAGNMIILTDHPDREDEGDLIIPAEITTPEAVTFMLRHGSGIICLSLPEPHIKRLGLELIVPPHKNTSGRGTPFCTPIEAKIGITTGVSARDRAMTILAAVHDSASANDIVIPGHVFPLQAQEDGVMARPGHTEGSIDIVKMAGFKPAAVLCELMNADGTMMKGESLVRFAKEHQLTILSIDDIIHYRRLTENFIQEEVSTHLPLKHLGVFQMTVVKEKLTDHEHIILIKENSGSTHPLLVRVHSSCITGEIFGSQRCDCRDQLQYSLERISQEGGMLIYLHQEGRGIGLFNKIKSYALQEKGWDTVDANLHLNLPVDSRNYHIAAAILRMKNISHIRLSNNPAKINELQQYGIARVVQEIIPIFCNSHNKNYLLAKKQKLNHLIDEKLFI